ncbi:MarR family transcriptional regulator [Mucilaginibacter sabulilitoris]|uniref:MarR family transcriptional regulator n=1 Tax=Mucilaginibacter sabulilitoris TaxID=1173583 RepID=A0ABZ0TTN2_9SPHI|nr:MarR family transcriptional regulator [Mucilaginibacter sabulilitoris]WPU96279.1 MarR family transcriptional regulator [Mucilaginibacter sabulilitoris]
MEKDILLASELRTVVTRLIKKLRKQSSMASQLSLTERSTVALLDQHGELLPNELAAMEKITTQSMSQILNKLLLLGFINRRISEIDKRKAIISLSDAGRAVLYQVRNERDEWLNKALDATCTAEEKVLLKKAIGPLTKLVDFD